MNRQKNILKMKNIIQITSFLPFVSEIWKSQMSLQIKWRIEQIPEECNCKTFCQIELNIAACRTSNNNSNKDNGPKRKSSFFSKGI